MRILPLAFTAASGAILLAHGASAINCPAAGSSTIVTLDASGGVSLGIVTDADTVCTLVAVTTNADGSETFMPYGRSYSGFNWEGVNPTNKDFACTASSCSTTLFSPVPTDMQFKLFSREHSATEEEQVSRLLIQSTFGPTKPEIENYINNGYTPAQFVRDQMDLPATHHRAFFRENSQARTNAAYAAGRPRLPCEAGSHWRNFALTWEDKDLPISVDNTTAPYTIRVQGEPRTQMDTLPYPFFPGYSGKLCSRPGARLGGRCQAAIPGESCKTFDNPLVQVLSQEVFANITDGTSVPIYFNLPGPTQTRGDQKIVHNESISDTSCATVPIAGGKTDIFGKDASGNWWLHDPILVLRANTPSLPLSDGGSSSAPTSLCASAPMTYQNEKYCFFSEDPNNCASRGIVCPGDVTEVANDPLSARDFDFLRDDATDTNNNAHIDFEYLKINSWMNIVLHSNDQLRQRVAWAFAQIITQVRAGQYLDGATERYLNFYDILVKHAFGNFWDILKDISFNPIMASSLTFLNSKSADQVRRESGSNVHVLPDENFAREVMELFTIGLWKQNADGTYQLDSQNQTIPIFDAADILDMARVWTGFTRQGVRGNIEGDFRNNAMTNNWQDPMKLVAKDRDSFPKMKLDGGYIGDGFPLCADLPDKPWLRKGATWRLLGTNYNPIMFDQDRLWKNGNLYVELSTTEPLFNILCGESGSLRGRRTSTCTYPLTVSLDSSLPLDTSSTSPMDSIRVVKVNDIYYEYVQTPCVDLPFYNGGKTVKDDNGKIMCATPDSMHGSACCASGTRSRPQCLYPGERVKYDTHESRCSGSELGLCTDFSDINGNFCGTNNCCAVFFWHWTSSSCDVKVKVTDDGRVGILHVPQSGMSGTLDMSYDLNARNYFRVDSWAGDNYPSPSNSCGNGACSLSSDDTCICQTITVNDPIFSSEYFSSTQPTDLSVITESLKIGSIDPTFHDAGIYTLLTTWFDSKVVVKAWNNTRLGKPEDIVVGVTENNTTRFFRNLKSTVKIVHASDGTRPYEFRNAPKFRPDLSSALVETDVVLDLLFRHQNTAPFISSRLIQRLGASNPSPGYVGRVASAFTTGQYTNGGIDFGTGEYGDLSSTIAAILLDREARTVAVEADPTTGSLREPLLRVIHLFRSLQYTGSEEFRNMDRQIGQMPYGFPSVFSFFLPHYSPTGPVLSAGLVAPEAFQYDTPNIVGLMKGLFSLTKYGMTNCFGGFYHSGGDCSQIDEGTYTSVAGQLTYVPTIITDQEMIEEVDLLLTGGRLSNAATTIIMEALSQVSTTEQKLRLTEQLILASPEYHASGQVQLDGGNSRFTSSGNEKEPESYKAIVYVFMEGGADTYNLLVPHSNCGTNDLYAGYANIRGDVALSKESLLTINTTSSQQPCSTFGIHPKFAHLRQLYEDGDATFFANTGFLNEPSDRSNYRANHGGFPIFSHTLQGAAMKVNPAGDAYSTGVLGRMMDVLYPKGYLTASTSTGRGGASSTGLATSNDPSKSPRVRLLSGSFGPTPFDPVPSIPDIPSRIKKLNNATTITSSIYGETWSSSFMDSLEVNQFAYEMLHTVSVDTSFPSSSIGSNLEFVSRMIKARAQRKVERDAFALVFGSFDSHGSTISAHNNLYETFNSALSSFTTEMKNQNVWDQVVLVAVSEFGRTLSPNSNLGTDHGWGGNYFAVGGSILGSKIHGSYPDDFSVNNKQLIGRGIVPTMPFEAMFNGIASWFGVEDSDLDHVLPNRNRFTSSLLSEDDIFHPVTLPPTASPTDIPSSAPSSSVTLDPNRYESFSTSFNFHSIRTDNTGKINGISQSDSRVTITGAYDPPDHVMSLSITGMDFDGGGKPDDSLSWKIRAKGMTNLYTDYYCEGLAPICGCASGGTPDANIYVNGLGWGVSDGTVGAKQSITFTVEDIVLNTNERGQFGADFRGFDRMWLTTGKYIFGYEPCLFTLNMDSHRVNYFDSPMKEFQYTPAEIHSRNREIGGWFDVSGMRDMCKEDGMPCTSSTDCCNGVCHGSGHCGDDIFMSQTEWSQELNLALSQPATQSSTAAGGVAGRAVDGNNNGKWRLRTTTHTNENYGFPSWWKVDLTRPGMIGMAEIKSITLWNRRDGCCVHRMDGLKIRILDSNNEEVRMVQIGDASAYDNTFVFDDPLPRGVTVEVVKEVGTDSVISIAEAVVMGRYLMSLEQGA